MRKRPARLITVLALVIMGAVALLSAQSGPEPATATTYAAATAAARADTAQLRVFFFDVGQGDCALLLFPDGQSLLIDSGEAQYLPEVLDALGALNVTKLDYVLATHPHADHIGGMAGLVESMPIGRFYMPMAEHTTVTFERMLDAVEARLGGFYEAKAGDTLLSGEGFSAVFVSPEQGEKAGLNDMSAVLMVAYGQTAFLFTGDAEEGAEATMLLGGASLSADVLKVGHHGSATSTTHDFLRAVAPSYAVISCGQGNPYGHPHPETLEKLADAGAVVLRTDELGTIAIISDGQNIIYERGE